MEKILVAINARQIDQSILDFACFIARLTRSKLTGIFLENLLADQELVTNELAGMEINGPGKGTVLSGAGIRDQYLGDHIDLFKSICHNQGVNCEVVYDHNMPDHVMITESRFADLVIVNASTSFEKKFEGAPTLFVKELLAHAECPVIVAPVSFEGIDEIIVAYDGSRSSVFALKQFSYLFPGLEDKRLIILQVNEKAEVPIAEKEKISNMLKEHFSAIGFSRLQGEADEELFKYLLDRKKSFVVMGAFGRSMLSNLVKRSTAELLMKVVNLPVFIAHH